MERHNSTDRSLLPHALLGVPQPELSAAAAHSQERAICAKTPRKLGQFS
jgi:hypothetical protein